MIQGIHQVVLEVDQQDRALAFWTEALGVLAWPGRTLRRRALARGAHAGRSGDDRPEPPAQ